MPKDGSPNRTRILDAAQTLVIDRGFAATSVDQVLAAAGTSKGAFFHHFDSKAALARALTERYVEGDLAQLQAGLAATADVTDPVARVLAFLRFYEDAADELMAEQSSCLYIAVLTEQQLVSTDTVAAIRRAIEEWRSAIARLISAAAAASGRPLGDRDEVDALADHVFVTFEGAFLLCRATGSPAHMRRQLRALRQLLAGALGHATPNLD